jgi:hypothetical protein
VISDVLSYDLFQPALAFQDEFDRVAQGAVSSATFGDVVRVFFHFIAGICHGDSKAAIPHHGQINDIVADKACFRRSELFLRQNFSKRSKLVLNALTDVVELEIARADRYGFRSPLGNQPGLDSGNTRQRNGDSIVGVKAFDLDGALAGEIESTRPAIVLGCCRQEKQLAVSDDTIHVEQQQLDLLRAGLRIGHAGIVTNSSRLSVVGYRLCAARQVESQKVMTKDPFSIDISLRHPYYKAERIIRALSIKPQGAYSVGDARGSRKAKRTHVYARLQHGDYASQFGRALFKISSFIKKNETFWADFKSGDGVVELILNHAISPAWEEDDQCFELSFTPAFLAGLSAYGIGLRVQVWQEEAKKAKPRKRGHIPKASSR